MNILLLGDYSNYHACLADALRGMGHRVTVASDSSGWMKTSCTLSLRRPLPGPAGGAALFFKMMTSRSLRGYDIVSLISPSFVMLRPARLQRVFEMLKKHNGRIFLNAAGTDKALMDMITSADCPLRYSEFHTPSGHIYEPNRKALESESLWQQGQIARWCETVYDNVCGVTTALYEYDLAMRRRLPSDKVRYVGIPVDMKKIATERLPMIETGCADIFLGRHRHRMAVKGTDRMERAARRLVADCPDRCKLTVVENLPYSEYIEKLKSADIILDQLYSYTPATNALLGMAMGKAVISGAEPEYYDFIGEKSLRPIINAVPDDDTLYSTMRNLVMNPDLIIKAASCGREFVTKHNDSRLVAQRCIDFWTA